jgi:hypothetical protein
MSAGGILITCFSMVSPRDARPNDIFTQCLLLLSGISFRDFPHNVRVTHKRGAACRIESEAVGRLTPHPVADKNAVAHGDAILPTTARDGLTRYAGL